MVRRLGFALGRSLGSNARRRLCALTSLLSVAGSRLPAQTPRVETAAERHARMAVFETHWLADAFGVVPLATGGAPQSKAEIRFAVMGGWPEANFRLLDSAGVIHGEKTVSWIEGAWAPSDQESYIRPVLGPDRCSDPVHYGQSLRCWVEWSQPPNWERVWTLLESAGVWRLPSPTSEPGADGWAVMVETRRGEAYDVRYYWLPDKQSEAVAQLARALTRVLDSLPRLPP
jgi:hypothetical protein